MTITLRVVQLRLLVALKCLHAEKDSNVCPCKESTQPLWKFDVPLEIHVGYLVCFKIVPKVLVKNFKCHKYYTYIMMLFSILSNLNSFYLRKLCTNIAWNMMCGFRKETKLWKVCNIVPTLQISVTEQMNDEQTFQRWICRAKTRQLHGRN